jgi:hypothetical protein
MSHIYSRWNPEMGEETKVSFRDDWESLSEIAKLDHLKDTIWELTQKYNSILSGWLNPSNGEQK